MTTAERIHKQGQQHISNLAATVRQLWNQACDHDGIPRDSKFVCFSNDNPYLQFHNQAMNQYFDAVREYQVGGYVGLQIVNGKAR